jgi:hypothetical protein
VAMVAIVIAATIAVLREDAEPTRIAVRAAP